VRTCLECCAKHVGAGLYGPPAEVVAPQRGRHPRNPRAPQAPSAR